MEVSSDATYNKRLIKEKSDKFDYLEEQFTKMLDMIRGLAEELYNCFDELKIVEDEITEIKDLCDELIEEEEE